MWLISGCGPRFVYPNLEWLIPLYVDDYISLNRAQSTMLEKRLSQQLDWHCRTQLPLYAESLKELAEDLRDRSHPVTYERIQYHHKRFLNHWRSLMRQIGPDIADILKTASDAQVTELFQNIEKQNQIYKSEYVDLPQNSLAQHRQEQVASFLEHWIRRIDPEQKRAISDWSDRLKPFAADRLQYRKAVLAEFRNLLDQRRDRVDFQAAFTGLLTHPERLRTSEYQIKVEYNTNVTIRFLMRMDQLLTDTQRGSLVNRIESLSADFDELSCGPPKVNRKASLS